MARTKKCKPLRSVTKKCDICNGNMKYTLAELNAHNRKDHNGNMVIAAHNTRLRFQRNAKSGLYSCACGDTLDSSGVRKHSLECVALKQVAADSPGRNLIDITGKPAVASDGKPGVSSIGDINNMKPQAPADRKCCICKDNKLYTRMELNTHSQKVHQGDLVIKAYGKLLRFRRNPLGHLYRCACGETLKGSTLKTHVLRCTPSMEIAAKALENKLADAVSTDVEKQPAIADKKCCLCDDDIMYTKADINVHYQREHNSDLIVDAHSKRFCFHRRQKDSLYGCVCGDFLKGSMLKCHCASCEACKEAAARAMGTELIDAASIHRVSQPKAVSNGRSSVTADKKQDGSSDDKRRNAEECNPCKHKDSPAGIIVTVKKKELCFRQRAKDNRLVCACGNLIGEKGIKKHALKCPACNETAASAVEGGVTDVVYSKTKKRQATASVGSPADQSSLPLSSLSHCSLSDDNDSDNNSNNSNGNVNVNVKDSDSRMGSFTAGSVDQQQQQHHHDVLAEPKELRPAQLVIHRNLNILLCKACKTVVMPDSVRDHLHKEEHASVLESKNQDALNTAVDYVYGSSQLLSREQINNWINGLLNRQKAGSAISQLPILRLYESGFKCSNCGYADIHMYHTLEHINDGSCGAAEATVLADTPLQQLGNDERPDIWIHVGTTDPAQGQPSSLALDLMASALLAAVQSYMKREAGGSSAASNPNATGDLAARPTKRIKLDE